MLSTFTILSAFALISKQVQAVYFAPSPVLWVDLENQLHKRVYNASNAVDHPVEWFFDGDNGRICITTQKVGHHYY
jgi:hypothetical protein